MNNKSGDIGFIFFGKKPEFTKQPKKHTPLLQEITNHLHIFATYIPSTIFQVV